MSNQRRTDIGLIGVFTTLNPLRFSARYVNKDADRLAEEIQNQYRLFNSPEQLARFLTSKHWYSLVGTNWALPSIHISQCAPGQPEARNPVDMGEVITLPGSDYPVETFTQTDTLKIADWLCLIAVPTSILVVYQKAGTEWKRVDAIRLERSMIY